MDSPRFNPDFLMQPPVRLARALLGQRLVRVIGGMRLAGLIVETEAYLGAIDRADHTYAGRKTQRNQSMWLAGGHAYIYFTYGMHHCMNVVAGVDGEPVAVLIRALEPTEGLDTMRVHRTAKEARDAGVGGRQLRDTQLCSGPGKLCQALAMDRSLDGVDLVQSGVLFLEQVRQRCYPARRLEATPRIGVDYAGAWAGKPLRFILRGNPHLSR